MLDKSTTVDMMGGQQTSLRVLVEITRGERKGHAIEVEYGAGLVMSDERTIQEGDRVRVDAVDGYLTFERVARTSQAA